MESQNIPDSASLQNRSCSRTSRAQVSYSCEKCDLHCIPGLQNFTQTPRHDSGTDGHRSSLNRPDCPEVFVSSSKVQCKSSTGAHMRYACARQRRISIERNRISELSRVLLLVVQSGILCEQRGACRNEHDL